jgi:hypothetical protein
MRRIAQHDHPPSLHRAGLRPSDWATLSPSPERLLPKMAAMLAAAGYEHEALAFRQRR